MHPSLLQGMSPASAVASGSACQSCSLQAASQLSTGVWWRTTHRKALHIFMQSINQFTFVVFWIHQGIQQTTAQWGDTEVTLKRDPKTDGLRRATQKANMNCTVCETCHAACLQGQHSSSYQSNRPRSDAMDTGRSCFSECKRHP